MFQSQNRRQLFPRTNPFAIRPTWAHICQQTGARKAWKSAAASKESTHGSFLSLRKKEFCSRSTTPLLCFFILQNLCCRTVRSGPLLPVEHHSPHPPLPPLCFHHLIKPPTQFIQPSLLYAAASSLQAQRHCPPAPEWRSSDAC